MYYTINTFWVHLMAECGHQHPQQSLGCLPQDLRLEGVSLEKVEHHWPLASLRPDFMSHVLQGQSLDLTQRVWWVKVRTVPGFAPEAVTLHPCPADCCPDNPQPTWASGKEEWPCRFLLIGRAACFQVNPERSMACCCQGYGPTYNTRLQMRMSTWAVGCLYRLTLIICWTSLSQTWIILLILAISQLSVLCWFSKIRKYKRVLAYTTGWGDIRSFCP